MAGPAFSVLVALRGRDRIGRVDRLLPAGQGADGAARQRLPPAAFADPGDDDAEDSVELLSADHAGVDRLDRLLFTVPGEH